MALKRSSCSSSNNNILVMPKEPDLTSIVSSADDRLTIRNIVYTVWSLFNSGDSSTSTSSIGCPYHVRHAPFIFFFDPLLQSLRMIFFPAEVGREAFCRKQRVSHPVSVQ